MITLQYTDFVSNTFHRRKNILGYLMEKDFLELLFQKVNGK